MGLLMHELHQHGLSKVPEVSEELKYIHQLTYLLFFFLQKWAQMYFNY